MKSFENIDVKSVKEAVNLLQKFQQQKKTAAVVGGGSEYLQLMKDHVVEPDYLINLKTIPGLDSIKEERGAFRIGALAKLADIEAHPAMRRIVMLAETELTKFDFMFSFVTVRLPICQADHEVAMGLWGRFCRRVKSSAVQPAYNPNHFNGR